MTAVVQERTESTAQEHAEFVTHSVIRPALSEVDLTGPLIPGDPRYEELRYLVVSDVLGAQFPVVRVNVWRSDGTVLFSDVPDLVGRRFTMPSGLRSAFGGRGGSAASDLDRPETIVGGDHPDAILATFIPLSSPSAGRDTRLVVEIDTDIAEAAVPIGRPFRLVGLALLGGLAAIYVIQLPLVRQLGRTLRAQNRKLHALLQQEQRTVEELRDLNRRQTEFLAIPLPRAPHAAHRHRRIREVAHAAGGGPGRGHAPRVPRSDRTPNRQVGRTDREHPRGHAAQRLVLQG